LPIELTNHYASLPAQFHTPVHPASFPDIQLIKLNKSLVESLGLSMADLNGSAGIELLAGVKFPRDLNPVAMVYAGHQFGGWAPRLGDGRAMLLGEIAAPDGKVFDLHLKGCGPTQYARNGDGKAPLGAVLREYLVSEAMFGLGISTTRALAVVATGERIRREGPVPGAVLARVAQSHIRVGTFQYFYGQKDPEALKTLLDFVLKRHYPYAIDAENPALALLKSVIARQADLIAGWMQFGFIHGVMNTDNMAISGETIDYGPCAFMDTYHPATVFSSIDQQGRYAWANQPAMAHWNLAQLAQSLLPLISADPKQAAEAAQDVLDGFSALFQGAYETRFAHKLGLGELLPKDGALIQSLMAEMQEVSADFTQCFRLLTKGWIGDDLSEARAVFGNSPAFEKWLTRWKNRLLQEDRAQAAERMKAANPIYIARNHRVEQAINAANNGDFEPFETLLKVVEKPFEERAEFDEYETAPRADEVVVETFCGT